MMLVENGRFLNGANTGGKAKPQTSNLAVTGSNPVRRAKNPLNTTCCVDTAAKPLFGSEVK